MKARPPMPPDAKHKQLSQDLLELDKAIAATDQQLHALREAGTSHAGVSAETLAALRNTLVEFREKILLLQAEIRRQHELRDATLSTWSWKLTAPARAAARLIRWAAGRGIKRIWWTAQEVEPLQPAVQTARRLLRDWRGGEIAGMPDRDGESPLRVAELANEHLTLDRGTIVEQALHQMRLRMGHAWEGYVFRAANFLDAGKLDVRAVAFYVPRFYRIPEEDGAQRNDINPWTNICEAMPQYLGHYQPRLPGELGFYDQRLGDVLRQQVELARQYGLHGFCFEYYWSRGRELLGVPVRAFLADRTLDISFCVCWMNWSSPEPQDPAQKTAGAANPLETGEASFIESLKPFFSDPRYIRIDGNPVLLVRAPGALPNVRLAVKRLREEAQRAGIPGLYLVGWVGDKEPADFNFDAAIEFPPDDVALQEITRECSLIDPGFSGHVFSYRHYVDQQMLAPPLPFVHFNSVVTSWDDESVRRGAGTSFAGATPALYARWLDRCCQHAMLRRPEERFVFINAWNDWAHGAYLEPDRKFGYAYLQATANTLRRYQDTAGTQSLIDRLNQSFARTSQVAIIFHCHYEDLVEPIFQRYFSRIAGADLFVSMRPDIDKNAIERMHAIFPNTYFLCEENRGRDIRPFLLTLRRIRELGYVIGCKVHTKKTPQADNVFGNSWRQRLIESLLGSEKSVNKALEIFSAKPDAGLLVPEQSLIDLRQPAYHQPNRFWLDTLLERLGRSDLAGNYDFRFPAGSMYWFRVEALAGLDDLILAEDAFEDELGQRDGTLAHAIERLVALYAQERGFSTQEIPQI